MAESPQALLAHNAKCNYSVILVTYESFPKNVSTHLCEMLIFRTFLSRFFPDSASARPRSEEMMTAS